MNGGCFGVDTSMSEMSVFGVSVLFTLGDGREPEPGRVCVYIVAGAMVLIGAASRLLVLPPAGRATTPNGPATGMVLAILFILFLFAFSHVWCWRSAA